MKAQIDWIPLSLGGVRPTQGKTLAVMQVSGGSQSFNTVNQLRVLGRWMRLITIPNQSSVPKAWLEFDEHGGGVGGKARIARVLHQIIDIAEALGKRGLALCGDNECASPPAAHNKPGLG